MKTFHIWTVGCQVNTADSGKLASGLTQLGWDPTDTPDDADFIIVNTCAIRQNAEDRAAGKLSAMAHLKRENPTLKIAMMGCLVGHRTEKLKEKFPYVDVFAQPQNFDKVISVIQNSSTTPSDTSLELGGEFWPDIFPKTDGPTSFIPIVEGCDKFCTYCIVPLRRGRERSRSIRDITSEVRSHISRGVKEVTLLGQTVEAYGKDQPPLSHGSNHADLYDLMASIHDTPGLSRIRALTSYPPDMTDRILEGMAELPKVCEAYSLPVQSGDDEILTRMRRGYNIKEFVNRVEKVRRLMPDAGISTDIIVGTPGETDAQFRNTIKLITELRFDKVHVATYSERPGTFAARFQPDDISTTEKHDRLQAIEETQRKISLEINQNLMGKVLEVLVEHSKSGKTLKINRLTGRTRNNKLVHFDGPAGATKIGMLVGVKITTTGAWSLQGQQVTSTIDVRD